MEFTKGQKRTLSESTKVLLRERAKERGERRSDAVRENVLAAMQTIKEEIDQNNGVYPGNRLSTAEVARRAGIHATTFFTDKQRALGNEVKKWIQDIESVQSEDPGRVRRSLASRLADWKQLYEGLAQSHRDTELELQETERLLACAQADLEELRRENEGLRKLLSSSTEPRILTLVQKPSRRPGKNEP